jgi:hypothetical protein
MTEKRGAYRLRYLLASDGDCWTGALFWQKIPWRAGCPRGAGFWGLILSKTIA